MKICKHCENSFAADNNAQRYCGTKCRKASQRGRSKCRPSGAWLITPVPCVRCSTPFLRTKEGGPNERYCSDKCREGRGQKYSEEFYKRNPNAMKKYNETRVENHGPDSLANRILKKYGLKRQCEAKGCAENRVVEIAHKPAHKRNGRWRTMDLYERHMFWILCPTHHVLLDREICTLEELGLEE